MVIIGNDGLSIPTEDTEAGIPTKECCTEVPHSNKLDHLSPFTFPESKRWSGLIGQENIHSAQWADEQAEIRQRLCKTPACCSTTQQVLTHITHLQVFLDNVSITHSLRQPIALIMLVTCFYKRIWISLETTRGAGLETTGPQNLQNNEPWYFIITS